MRGPPLVEPGNEPSGSRGALLDVVIADDHVPTRALVRDALERGGLHVVGEAADSATAVALVRRCRPAVALLDVRMPGGGIAAAATISAEQPQTAVVMLTVSEDDEDLFAALRVGATGYVLKGGDPDALPAVLRKALAGEAVLHGALLAKVLREFQDAERRRRFGSREKEQLTRREYEVLALLHAGSTTTEIAEQLFIAKVTVRSHVAAICRKLRLPDREAALRELRSVPVADGQQRGHVAP